MTLKGTWASPSECLVDGTPEDNGNRGISYVDLLIFLDTGSSQIKLTYKNKMNIKRKVLHAVKSTLSQYDFDI